MKTKNKKGAAADNSQPTAPKAAEYVRKRVDIEIGQLRTAEWNPRGKITPESVADLAASIKSLGLIQPVVAMMDADGTATLIAGHRRVVAAKLAGLDKVPCDVLVGVDEETARRMTFIENLQRADADPLLESELVGSLVKSGMTLDEIAAETGRGRQWVARRANLANLSPSWRKRVKSGEQITIDCLEHVAAYPAEIQEKCKDASGSYYGNSQGVAWHDVKWQFQRETRDLREVLFDTAKCLGCPNNTGCSPELFDWDGKTATFGKCMDAKCFQRKTEQAVDDAVAKAETKGRTIVKNMQPYQVGVYGSTKKPTKTNTALYVYTDCNGNRVMEYAEPPPPEEKKKAKTKEERQAEREAKRICGLLQDAKDEAAQKFDDWTDEHASDGSWPQWFVDAAVERMVGEIRDYGCGDMELVVDAFARNTGFTASDAEADKVYQEYLAKLGKESGDE